MRLCVGGVGTGRKRGNCKRVLKVNIMLDLRLDVNQGDKFKKEVRLSEFMKTRGF